MRNNYSLVPFLIVSLIAGCYGGVSSYDRSKSLGELDRTIAIARDAEHPSRLEAVYSLGEANGQAVIETLFDLLGDTDKQVIHWAANSLGRIGRQPHSHQGIVKKLLTTLRDDKFEYRNLIYFNLGIIGSQEAVEILGQSLMDESDSDVQLAIISGLKEAFYAPSPFSDGISSEVGINVVAQLEKFSEVTDNEQARGLAEGLVRGIQRRKGRTWAGRERGPENGVGPTQ